MEYLMDLIIVAKVIVVEFIAKDVQKSSHLNLG